MRALVSTLSCCSSSNLFLSTFSANLYFSLLLSLLVAFFVAACLHFLTVYLFSSIPKNIFTHTMSYDALLIGILQRSIYDEKQKCFMRVIHHLEMFSSIEAECLSKNNAAEITDVRMAVQAGPRGVICGPTVPLQFCCGAIKHRLLRVSKWLSCSWFCQP